MIFIKKYVIIYIQKVKEKELINMYEIKGFIFQEKDGKIEKNPIAPGLLAKDYDEVHEAFKEIGFIHYMFILVPSKEVK
mgnify:CR=1 FL=1